jgi:hypothetical protein
MRGVTIVTGVSSCRVLMGKVVVSIRGCYGRLAVVSDVDDGGLP